MPTKIKLKRIGRKRLGIYRIVIADESTKRDGKVISAIGTYNPTIKPPELNVDKENLKIWLDRGAKPTQPVRKLLKL